MQRLHWWRILWSVVLFVTLLLVSSAAQAGSLQQEEPQPVDTETGPVAPLDPVEEMVSTEGEPEPMGPAAAQASQAAPAAFLNYQGFLTNAAGTALNNPQDMTFYLFEVASGGMPLWGPELHTGVPVDKGLFHVVLGSVAPIDPAMFQRQLFLEMTIGSTVLPRQALHPAPYALGLTLGAHVRGSSATENGYGLSITNEGGRGVYINAKGDGLIALYSADRIYAAEGYSGPDTVVWAPGNNLRLYASDTLQGHIDQYGAGLGRVNMDANNETVRVTLPVQLERLYGRAFRLTHVTLYYKVGAPAYIDEVHVEGRDYNTNVVVEEVVTNNGASAAYAKYEITVDPPIEINNAQAVSNLWLILKSGTPGGENGYVDIYAARLTLDSDY